MRLPLLGHVPLTGPGVAPGSVVVVVGASSGIGEAAAELLAERGCHVVLASRDEETLDQLARTCLRRGAPSAQVVATDVGDDGAVADLVAAVLERHGRIDAVLHCSGVVTYGRAEDTSPEDFASVVSTNLLGAASVARHVVPVLRRQRRGDLVLVGSLLGQIAVPEMTAYVASKWGLRGLARQLVVENVDLPHVHVCHVSPGSVDTGIYGKALSGGDDGDGGGSAGPQSPPPPTISPRRAAAVVVDQIGGHRSEVETAASNYAVIAAFRLAPRAWDRLVGPVFTAVSRRRD